MREALLPLGATAVLAFFVYRWAGDEFARERHLSIGAANAVVTLFILHAMLVTLAAIGGVARFDLPVALTVALGVPLAIGGAALVVSAARALESRERLLGITVDRVLTDGPYRRERHPFYAGWSLTLLGVAVAGGSALSLGLVVVLIAAVVMIARFEERLLSEQFPSAWKPYRKETPAVAGIGRSAAVENVRSEESQHAGVAPATNAIEDGRDVGDKDQPRSLAERPR